MIRHPLFIHMQSQIKRRFPLMLTAAQLIYIGNAAAIGRFRPGLYAELDRIARVFFMEFRESSLEFELQGWIEDVDA
jgi:hypothetical protein